MDVMEGLEYTMGAVGVAELVVLVNDNIKWLRT